MRKNHLVGEILIDKGYLSPAEMELGLAHQKASRKKLGESLIDLGLITRDQLYDALASKFSMPVVELSPGMLSAELWQKIPRSFVVEYGIIPIFEDGETLHVVVADPNNLGFEDKLEKVTGYKISVSLADESMVKLLISDWLSLHETSEDYVQPLKGHEGLFKPYSSGAVEILALTGTVSAGLYYRGSDLWCGFEGKPAQFVKWIRNRSDLPGDFYGNAWVAFQTNDQIIPARIHIIPLMEGERIYISLGREMLSRQLFSFSQNDRYREILENKGWVILKGNDPWIVQMGLELLPRSESRHPAWLALTVPGSPVPETVPRIEVTGNRSGELREALEIVQSGHLDGLIVDTSFEGSPGIMEILTQLNNQGTSIIQIFQGWGSYLPINQKLIETNRLPVNLINVTRLRRICRNCRSSIVKISDHLKLPGSLERELNEAKGCKVCHGGVLGTISFIEELVFHDGKWHLCGNIPYPLPGSPWNCFPDGSTPAAVLGQIENLFSDDLIKVMQGWQIMRGRGAKNDGS